MKTEKPIDAVVIKQVFFLAVILFLCYLIISNLLMFIPAFLGAVTLYVICRNLNFYLQDERKWKPAWASSVLLVSCFVVLILPLYLLGEVFVKRLGNSHQYLERFTVFLNKIQTYILNQTGFDILSTENSTKIQTAATKLSTSIVSETFNTVTVVLSMFFILYFMFANKRIFEKLATKVIPLKRSNVKLIGQKFRKLVLANAIGIPVVAVGQSIIALFGYLIFGAPNPILLFALSAIASMIPIVGSAIIWAPVAIFMIAEGQTAHGIGLVIYCIIVVGLTDNLLRFTLLKKIENIHPLNTVFGIILGMNIFGFIGLIFGPILVSITILLIQIYRDEFSDKENPDWGLPE